MKALLLYSHQSGKRDFTKQLAYVKAHLDPVFETLDCVCTFSAEEAGRLETNALAKGYGALLIVGGDGTFNNAVNHVMSLPERPVLGYLNFGTIGDVGKNFGIHHSFHEAVSIIEKGHIEPFDVGEINGSYFAYTCAIGRYSDIAYMTPRREKRKSGKAAYYREATKQAFQKKVMTYQIQADGQCYTGETPFLMVLNGRYMGGFSVNSAGKINDGKMELYLTEPGVFNGLPHYFFHYKIKRIRASSFEISQSEATPWCLDGEKGPKGKAHIACHPSALRIFSVPLRP